MPKTKYHKLVETLTEAEEVAVNREVEREHKYLTAIRSFQQDDLTRLLEMVRWRARRRIIDERLRREARIE